MIKLILKELFYWVFFPAIIVVNILITVDIASFQLMQPNYYFGMFLLSLVLSLFIDLREIKSLCQNKK